MSMSDINERIIPINVEQEMKSSYLDYAMSVIVSRAIPDVRDGLKPVHRRILYSMHEAGYHANRPHRKSARIVGDVIGKYHPHGDVAVYDSLVRMAQDFSLRLPLIDGQGNFGSMDGDSAAAMRYTESRLSHPAHTLLEDIDKETVAFQPNYDGSEEEPLVLPAMFPNLLVNGGGGIAVGMATNIPPHNLGEVIDACCHYLDHPDCSIDDLIDFVKGPDFPTAASIIGSGGIRSAYHTGKGSIVIRSKSHIEDFGNRQAIIITEIPYMVNKAKLIEKIAELVRDKRVEGISDLRDESNKMGVRVVIELKRDAAHEVILNQLHNYTSLQTFFGINMLALNKGMPQVMNLKEVISAFIIFREEVITNRTIFLLNKARDRAHILVGLSVAVSNIDEVIRIIRAAKTPQEAQDELMSRKWPAADIMPLVKLVDDKAIISEDGNCSFSSKQSKAILEMRLQRLTAMEKDKITNDLGQLAEEIKEYLSILGSRQHLLSIVKDELAQIKEKYATPRLTDIEEGEYSKDIEDLIQKEDMVVIVTLGGYIKRVPLTTYRAQNRGGKGRSGMSLTEDDITTQIFVGHTHTPMLFFSNTGQVYSLKLYKLPQGSPQSKGRPMVNLLPLQKDEKITNIMPMPDDKDEWDNLNIMFATTKGQVRRNDLSDFKKIQANGKIAIRLDEDDRLVAVKVCNEDNHILLATYNGKAIRFPASSVRVFKSRTSDGVRGMKLSPGDRVISMTVLNGVEANANEREAYLSVALEERIKLANDPDMAMPEIENISKDKFQEMLINEEFILSVSEKGFGKRSSAYGYRITGRAGSGVVNMVVSDKTGNVVDVMPVEADNELMLVTNKGQIIRCKLDTLRATGRSTSGVILFKTAKGEHVMSAALISESQEDDKTEESEIQEESNEV